MGSQDNGVRVKDNGVTKTMGSHKDNERQWGQVLNERQWGHERQWGQVLHSRIDEAWPACRHPIQFSISKPPTRSNSRRLFVTSTSPALRACPAMWRSFTPIGRPARSSAAQITRRGSRDGGQDLHNHIAVRTSAAEGCFPARPAQIWRRRCPLFTSPH